MYLLAVLLYALVVVLANVTVAWFIPLPVFGMLSVGTLFFGATFTLRDYVHHYGRKYIYLMIGIAAVVNVIAAKLLGTPDRFVIASFITIILAEAADTEVYQRFIRRPWLTRVLVSNSISVPMDSILFTLIAFYGVMTFTEMAGIVWGDIVAKYAIAALLAGWRFVWPMKHVREQASG